VSAAREAKCRASKLHKVYQDSGNQVVLSLHMVTSTIASFDENETADAAGREDAESEFSMEAFERKLIVPEVLDAYTSTDDEVLKIFG
jgi:hypothetical protein